MMSTDIGHMKCFLNSKVSMSDFTILYLKQEEIYFLKEN